MASLILTLVGPDRPGVVGRIAERVAAHGGSWLESRLAHLGGQFAGIVLVSVADTAAAGLRHDLSAANSDDLQVDVHLLTGIPSPPADTRLVLELLCQDRPGLVRDVTVVLADAGVNIEEFTSNRLSGSFSGETMFRAEAVLRMPDSMTSEALRGKLERLGNELMVDFKLTVPSAAT